MRGAGSEFAKQLKDHYPKILGIISEKKALSVYIEETKELVSSKNILVRGMETH
jgi:hypothetical protein